MKLLKVLARASPVTFWLAAVLGVVTGVAGMGVIAEVNRALGGGATAEIFWAFAVLCVLRLVLGFGSQLALSHLGQKTMSEFRVKLGRAVLDLPQRSIEEIGPPRLLATLSDDILVLTRSAYLFASVISQVACVVACGVYLGVLSPPLLGILTLILASGIALGQVLSKKASRLLKRAREAQDELFSGLRGLTVGNKELKLHAARGAEFMAQAVEAPGRAYQRGEVRGATLGFLSSQWTSLLFLVLVGVLLFITPPSDNHVLTSYVLAVLYMQSSVDTLLRAYPGFLQADVALAKLESFGLSITKVAEAPGAAPLSPGKEIALRGVVHEYQREEGEGVFALGPIDLVLHPGEITFIVGGNGSGKSTLVKLLTGLYDPQAGEIRIDGRVVDASNRASYRQMFSAVFSDWFLFDRLYGFEGKRVDEDAPRHLAELKLDKKVSLANGVFSTTDLSQGQRKRLMMLTAYLEDRPVYVFDEWASDQDPVFKEYFYRRILRQLKERGKTVVVVSHDDRYFSVADRIVRLEAGQMVTAREPSATLQVGELVGAAVGRS